MPFTPNKVSSTKNISNITDEALIQQLIDGDETALNELMLRYKGKLHAFINHYVKDTDIAYDILQEVFLKVYLKAGTFSPSYHFSTWVYKIAINLCHDWSRKQKFKNIFSLDSFISSSEENNTYHDILTSPQKNIEDLTDLRQQLDLLATEIPKLPHKLKTALILFTLEGKSQEECAKLMGVTVKTVETRVYRARKILINKMAKNF